MKKYYLMTFFIISFSIFQYGCKHEKGCTNPHALNFNSLADEDDGSCIVCSQHQSTVTVPEISIIDNNFSSAHYNQVVAFIHYSQVSNKYNYTNCGASECKIYYNIESLVNQEMTFFLELEANGNISFNTNADFYDIPAFQTTTQDTIHSTVFSPCGAVNNTNFSYFLSNNITYH